MKIEFYKQRQVTITLTRKQLDAIFAALDSVCSFGDENGAYKDVFSVHRMMIRELNWALIRSGEKDPPNPPTRGY